MLKQPVYTKAKEKELTHLISKLFSILTHWEKTLLLLSVKGLIYAYVNDCQIRDMVLCRNVY